MIKLNKVYKDRSGNDVRIICVDRLFVCVDRLCDLPIVGLLNEYGSESIRSYTSTGRFVLEHDSAYDLILPEDYSTYVIDEPVMVRDGDSSAWGRSYFAGVSPVNGRPCAWDKQRTSWTETCRVVWNQCRRPTKEELGK